MTFRVGEVYKLRNGYVVEVVEVTMGNQSGLRVKLLSEPNDHLHVGAMWWTSLDGAAYRHNSEYDLISVAHDFLRLAHTHEMLQ